MDANFESVKQENVFESSHKHLRFKNVNFLSAAYASKLNGRDITVNNDSATMFPSLVTQ